MSEGWLEGEREMPWPRAGDQLFVAASDWWMNASVNLGSGNLLIATGYQRGGDLLVETVASNRHEADALVYPIVFCYRQYLELLLKEAPRRGVESAIDMLDAERQAADDGYYDEP